MSKKKIETGVSQEKLITKEKVMDAVKGETGHFVIGLFFVVFAVYLFAAFTSFFFTGGDDQSILQHSNPGELADTANQIQNYQGSRGAQVAQFFINDCFGIPAYFIAIFFLVAGMKLMKAYRFTVHKWFISCFSLMIWMSVTFGFALQDAFAGSFVYPGGLHGYNLSRWICSQIGSMGLILVLLFTFICICIYFTRQTIHWVRRILHPTIRLKIKTDEKANPIEETTEAEEEMPEATEPETPVEKETDADLDEIFDRQAQKNGLAIEDQPSEAIPLSIDPAPEEPSVPTPEKTLAESVSEEPEFIIEAPAEEENSDDMRGNLSQPYNPRLDLEHYQFPTIDLLNPYSDNDAPIDMEEQNANKDRIIQVLRSFGIEIDSIKASVGPTITLYEITPAEGVRISRIRNLEDDIALKLAALGIRIIAPMPGKGTIGIEVPNAKPRIVPMSTILSSKKYQETTFELPIALGRTITNEVFMVDLAKAPHMLVAGATGMGKSVGLNAIVTSLLYKKHPSELKFVIIDPKKVEFAIYAPIENHYLAKLPDTEDAIITDVTKVVQTLNSLCVEMDHRYDLLKVAGCRNIKEYNKKFIDRQLNPENGHHFLPYIVVIIDEFGDLIMTAGKDVELPICRIAQLARAVGIHAIIATQRPTTNIITGTIKTNFPARVAFRVVSMMDSRTILDRGGAQQLIGKGDMLYLQGSDPVRVQCAFVDTPEVEKIVDFISRQQGYPTAFMLPECETDTDDGSGSSAEVDMNRLDPLFEEAARLLIYHQQGSTSLIQRKFSIGYNRAGRLMDQLEKAGIVGPTNGSKARDVLCMDENDLQMRLSNLNK